MYIVYSKMHVEYLLTHILIVQVNQLEQRLQSLPYTINYKEIA